MWAHGRSCSGQASVEYVGAVLVVAVLFGALLAVGGLARPAAGLAQAIAERLLCAVRLSASCRPPATELQRAYGAEVALLAHAHAPEIRFEDGAYVSLPVDPRRCRDRKCADSSERGRLGRSFEDEPATGFVRVIDCREPPFTAGVECSGSRRGNLYLQYWLYYPDSATRPWGRKGYHRDDWESYQVRIGTDGSALARASSHHGYNHGPDPGSDLGRVRVGPIEVDERRPAWGPAAGYLWVAAGSHAGRAAAGEDYFRSIPAGRLRLLPLEAELRSLSGLDFAVTPPWLKQVWRDPEAIGT